MGDQVVGENACFLGRRFVNRCDHLDDFVLHGDFNAESTKLAARLHLHVLESLRVHVAGVRVKTGQHAIDGRVDQLFGVRFFDVVGAHPVKHVTKQVEVTVGILV